MIKPKITEKANGSRRAVFRVKGYAKPQTLTFAKGTGNREIYEAVDKRAGELKAQLRTAGATADGRTGFTADVDRYLALPGVADMPTRSERETHLRTLADRFFHHRNRLDITKQEIETALATLQKERGWEASTFNKWLTALKCFYNRLEDPNAAQPNPARKIHKQREPEAMPRAVDYAVIVRVLERLKPTAQGKIDYRAEHEARRLLAEGGAKTHVAARLGVSEAAIRKLAARPRRERPASAEVERLALRGIAFTGLRHSQIKKLRPEHFDSAHSRVWVTASKKGGGDASFWKPLEPLGVAVLREWFALSPRGSSFDNHNARRQWRAACKAEGLTTIPRPYDLRHSYLTEAYLACRSLSALKAHSGHRRNETLERYTKAAEDTVARTVADGLGARLAAQGITPEAIGITPEPDNAGGGQSSGGLLPGRVAQLAATKLRLVKGA